MDFISNDVPNSGKDASTSFVLSPSINQEDLELLCTCIICQEIMHVPKTLHCKHSYCKDCIEELVEFQVGDVPGIKCPQCRRITTLSKDEVVSTLDCDSTLIELMKRIQDKIKGDNGNCAIEDKQIINCSCTKPAYFYCWSCRLRFCMECCNERSNISTACCGDAKLIYLQYSHRFDKYSPYCKLHNAFHVKGCLTCADTLCSYCGIKTHKEHQVVTFTEYTNKFKLPLVSKVHTIKDYIKKQEDLLEAILTKSNFDIDSEKCVIDRFINQRKIVLLSQVLLMLEVTEQLQLNVLSLVSENIDDLFVDPITVGSNLFNTALEGFEDAHIWNLQDVKPVSVIRSVSTFDDNLNPLLFPVIRNYEEAEHYVNETLRKMNLYTDNKLMCFSQSGDGNTNKIEWNPLAVRLVLSVLYALELCEKKIIKKFYQKCRAFKNVLAEMKDDINKVITSAKELSKEFQDLNDQDEIYIMSHAMLLLKKYYLQLHPKIMEKHAQTLPKFIIEIKPEDGTRELNCLRDLFRDEFVMTAFDLFSIDLDSQEIQLQLDGLLRTGDIEETSLCLYWSVNDCQEAEKYIHKRLKDIGLHNRHQASIMICKEDILSLVGFGFPLQASINALYYTNNSGVEMAMEWIFEHSADPDFNTHLLLDYHINDLLHQFDFGKLKSIGLTELEESNRHADELMCSCNFEESSSHSVEMVNDASSANASNGHVNNNDCNDRKTEILRRKSTKRKLRKERSNEDPDVALLYYLSNLALNKNVTNS